LLRGRRDFSRGQRDCLAAYRFFHCRVTDFFRRRDINFFIIAILIILRRDIDFFLHHRRAQISSIAPRRARISASHRAGREFQHCATPGANFSVAPRGTQISASRR
jgi:hypothetical protein